MSREAYQVPTTATTTAGGGSQSQTQPTLIYGSASQQDPGALTQYLCGDCASKVQLKKGDPIRCKECGHRVLYKERTRRMVQFEAR